MSKLIDKLQGAERERYEKEKTAEEVAQADDLSVAGQGHALSFPYVV